MATEATGGVCLRLLVASHSLLLLDSVAPYLVEHAHSSEARYGALKACNLSLAPLSYIRALVVQFPSSLRCGRVG